MHVRASHDLVVIGAGPVGALAAHAFARRGARVALIEASPHAASRLSGEWIHPTGVEVLDRLRAGRLEDQGARTGYGFAVIPDDGSPLIELPYPGGAVSLACEHRGIVASLRERAIGHALVTYLPRRRTVAITERGVIVENEHGGAHEEVPADLVIGADGRSSITARHLGAGDGELVSYMAAVELRGVELPREGFGHLVLGGPGPALLYRLDGERVRACLDVPLAFGGAARTPQFLWDGFAPVLPPRLRGALRRALEDGPVLWAATRFRPRAHYRKGRVMAVGDAVGHCHPLTAIGLTQGFLDVEAAASGVYPGPRARDSYGAELLANGLYHVLRRDDRCSTAIRSTIYDTWRANGALREYTMQLLVGGARRPIDFGVILGRLAAGAIAREVRDAGLSPRLVARAAAFRRWLPWGVAAVLPEAVRSTTRGLATATAPLPGTRALVDETEHVAVAPLPVLDEMRIVRAQAEVKAALQNIPLANAPKPRDPRALRARQGDDGALAGPNPVAETAAAVETWIASGIPASDPSVRRAVRWLVRHQTPDGAWQDARGAPASALATARAVCALAAANNQFRAARELGASALVELVSTALLDRGQLRDASYAPILAEAARALAVVRGDERLAIGRPAGRPRRDVATDDDRSYCRQALGEVSRTFARPIAMLPEPLATAVGCGYLLCRIADTIEDHPSLPLAERDRLFGVFLAMLDGEDPRLLARGFEAIAGDDAELALGRNTPRVMRVIDALDGGARAACSRWIAEMARGMNLYIHRQPGPDGISALTTLADLERYCYFVAGTVGHLLTDLFASVFDPAIVLALRVDAERFGAGLQMVNILKDITEDRARGWSYIPRSTCAEHGLAVSELVDPAHRERAHAAVSPVFAMARTCLDGALRYALAVPPAQTGVRLFCLMPLWMAVRTLLLARGNDAMFVTGAEVKISRAEVEAIINELTRIATDDDALARRYLSLWEGQP